MKRLKEKYAYRKLRHRLESVRRTVQIPQLETAKKVGVLWQPSQSDGFRYLHDYFSHSKVIFRNLCVYDNGAASLATGSNSVNKKDLDWFGLPKSTTVDQFIETEFDLLLNLALKQNFVLDYITALSRAKFKVGWSKGKNNYFDLNINISRKQDALYLAKQQIFYLGELNKTDKNA
jgi:hypothetical protein